MMFRQQPFLLIDHYKDDNDHYKDDHYKDYHYKDDNVHIVGKIVGNLREIIQLNLWAFSENRSYTASAV